MGPLNSAVVLITGGQENEHDLIDHFIKCSENILKPLKPTSPQQVKGCNIKDVMSHPIEQLRNGLFSPALFWDEHRWLLNFSTCKKSFRPVSYIISAAHFFLHVYEDCIQG